MRLRQAKTPRRASNVDCQLERRMDIRSLIVGESNLGHFPDAVWLPTFLERFVKLFEILLAGLQDANAILFRVCRNQDDLQLAVRNGFALALAGVFDNGCTSGL